MYARILQVQTLPKRDTVERANRSGGGKAATWRVQAETGPERLGPAARGPVVEIAEDRGWHILTAADGRADRGKLHRPVAFDQAQMHADHPKGTRIGVDLGQYRTAWLQPRQDDAADRSNIQVGADKQGLTVPAKAWPLGCEGQGTQARHLFDEISGQSGTARGKTVVNLLQGDDVCADRRHDLGNTRRIAAAVEAKALVRIV